MIIRKEDAAALSSFGTPAKCLSVKLCSGSVTQVLKAIASEPPPLVMLNGVKHPPSMLHLYRRLQRVRSFYGLRLMLLGCCRVSLLTTKASHRVMDNVFIEPLRAHSEHNVTHKNRPFSGFGAASIPVSASTLHDTHNLNVIKCNHVYCQPTPSTLFKAHQERVQCGDTATPVVPHPSSFVVKEPVSQYA